jgi:uncharacterized protein (TIGR02996 family)
MNHPENHDLLAGIIANAEDDAPRLVYADWLEENGDPDRAEFIRVQCALFDKSPAEPDYVDLMERKMAVLPTLRRRPLEPKLPKAVGFHDNPHEKRDDSGASYHRGFPYFGKEPSVKGMRLADEQYARQFRDALPEVIATTTLRGFNFSGWFSSQLAEILPSPAAVHIHALSADNEPATAGRRRGTVDLIVSSPPAQSLRWLDLHSLGSADAQRLAGSNALQRLRRLEIAFLHCRSSALRRLTTAEWFGWLRRIEVRLADENGAAGVSGFGKLPDLHTLELRDLAAEGVAAFAKAGSFRGLGKLSLPRTPLHGEGAVALAGARMPKLAVLALQGCGLRNEDVTVLSRSALFSDLRMLLLASNGIGDKGVAAIAGSPAARTLRVLSIGDTNFGMRGLAAIAKAGAFPSLTNLDLQSSLKRKATAEDVTRFLAEWGLPRLRFLDLQGWPLGDKGAKALAANPAFANLVGLNLWDCQIGPKGCAALFASPHLRHLVKLDLYRNRTGKAIEALLDPAVMPNLCECWQAYGDLSDNLKKRIQAVRERIIL